MQENNDIRRWGTGFALITLLLLAVGFYLYLVGYFNQSSKVEMMQGVNGQEMVIQPSQDHHYRIKGEINGVEVTFLLDTGASGIAVGQTIADEAGLRPGAKITVSTANGTLEAPTTQIALLKVASIRMRNVPATIMPNMDDEVLLGMQFLKYFDWRREKGNLILVLDK
ncbi:retropepsin-like aspartic protease family protein [Suttonella ornithocola]|uniref:Predicted aspartyl protease n=1 Tax=Suttonella ornithocola TaxID=279832 RepID=A0A380MVE9_9GAMM|nr:retropepsin-like aspartic protease [Suttonella ornithocola]SUO95377.1 Predicted aspartyl protease [Suttonella ornithocola]